MSSQLNTLYGGYQASYSTNDNSRNGSHGTNTLGSANVGGDKSGGTASQSINYQSSTQQHGFRVTKIPTGPKYLYRGQRYFERQRALLLAAGASAMVTPPPNAPTGPKYLYRGQRYFERQRALLLAAGASAMVTPPPNAPTGPKSHIPSRRPPVPIKQKEPSQDAQGEGCGRPKTTTLSGRRPRRQSGSLSPPSPSTIRITTKPAASLVINEYATILSASGSSPFFSPI